MADTREAASGTARFRCLRCGSELMLPYTPGKIEERSCPNCESNSVRRLKPEPAKPALPGIDSRPGARHAGE